MSPTARSGKAFPSDPRLAFRRGARLPALALAWVLLLIAGSALGARVPYSSTVRFTIATQIDSTGAATPVVRVEAPYRALVFERRDDGWRSGLRVVVVAKRGSDRVGGGVAETFVTASTYDVTRSETTARCEVPVLVRGDRPVVLELAASVKGTERTWRGRLDLDPRQGAALPWFFADLNWNLPADHAAELQLGAGLDSLIALVTLGRRPDAESMPTRLEVRIGDDRGEAQRLVSGIDLPDEPDGDGRYSRTVALAAADLPFGRSRLDLLLIGGEGGPEHSLALTPQREFLNLALPWRDDDAWDQHVGWLELLVDGEGRDRLASVPALLRIAAWDSVWTGIETAPGFEGPGRREHLLRVVAADRRFGRFGRGAETDRGRVYILYGPPDRIESRGDEYSFSAAWEVWYYQGRGLAFLFYDANGLGEFRLHSRQSY